MSTAIAPTPTVPTVTQMSPTLHRFSVNEYHQMIESGILNENDKVELLSGLVVEKMAIDPSHSSAVKRCELLLSNLLGQTAHIRTENPVTLIGNGSEPEPDLAIVVPPLSLYDSAHPVASQIYFLIEVANTSLRQDRIDKLVVYAAAGIKIYWILNLIDRQLEVYTDPVAGTTPKYTTRTDYDLQSQVPVVIAGQTVGTLPVKEMFPS